MAADSIQLNPNNPLGIDKLRMTVINTVGDATAREFRVETGDPVSVFAISTFMEENYDVNTFNMSIDFLRAVINGSAADQALYNAQVYELAGNAGGGILCTYNGDASVTFHFICDVETDNPYYYVSTQPRLCALDIPGIFPQMFYIVQTNLVNGSISEYYENYGGVYGAPFTIETLDHIDVNGLGQAVPVYDYTKYNTIDKARLYSGDDLMVTEFGPNGQPVEIFRNPNIYAVGAHALVGGFGDWMHWAKANIKYDEDPQNPSDYSDPDAPGGNEQDSIDIDFPELPPNTILQSGIIKMFNPSLQDMRDFCNFIYSAPDNIITNFKKIWANPMDSIIQLALIPFSVNSTGSEEIKFCGIGTGVYAPTIDNPYITVDCGVVLDGTGFNDGVLHEGYGTVLDYANYTKVKCYFPFIGIKELNTDDVMGARLSIKYNIDLLTGDCVAMLKCSKSQDFYDIDYNSVLYMFNGNCLSQVPLTGNNYQQLYSSIIGLVSNTIAPTPTGVAGMASDILGQKITVQRSGNLTGNVGAMSEYTPYLIVEKPCRSVPEHNNKYVGYPINKTYKLGATDKSGALLLSGYTEIEHGTFRTTGFSNPIMDEEAVELVSILEGGFII